MKNEDFIEEILTAPFILPHSLDVARIGTCDQVFERPLSIYHQKLIWLNDLVEQWKKKNDKICWKRKKKRVDKEIE